MDLTLNLSGQNFLSVNMAHTWSDEDPSGVELAERGLGRVRLERRGLDGFGMDLAASRVGSRYTSAADLVTLNARLRDNRREGQDLYLVFNDGLNTERAAFEPGLPLSAGRALLLKYSHAVPFGW